MGSEWKWCALHVAWSNQSCLTRISQAARRGRADGPGVLSRPSLCRPGCVLHAFLRLFLRVDLLPLTEAGVSLEPSPAPVQHGTSFLVALTDAGIGTSAGSQPPGLSAPVMSAVILVIEHKKNLICHGQNL